MLAHKKLKVQFVLWIWWFENLCAKNFVTDILKQRIWTSRLSCARFSSLNGYNFHWKQIDHWRDLFLNENQHFSKPFVHTCCLYTSTNRYPDQRQFWSLLFANQNKQMRHVPAIVLNSYIHMAVVWIANCCSSQAIVQQSFSQIATTIQNAKNSTKQIKGIWAGGWAKKV